MLFVILADLALMFYGAFLLTRTIRGILFWLYLQRFARVIGATLRQAQGDEDAEERGPMFARSLYPFPKFAIGLTVAYWLALLNVLFFR